ARFGGAATVCQAAGYLTVASGAFVVAFTTVQVASGGSVAGGWTVGAGVPVGAGATVGAGVAVGAAVGVAVGAGVGLGAAVGVALGAALGDALGGADGDADALGLGDGSGVTGRARMTTAAPLRSWSWSVAPRGSTRATPPRAARYAVSWVIRSSAQAARVVASGPIAAIDPLVVYG